MTLMKFHSCACVVEWIEPLTDYDRQAVFVEQCRTHDTPRQAFDHNSALRIGPIDNEVKRYSDEAAKPQFQRR